MHTDHTYGPRHRSSQGVAFGDRHYGGKHLVHRLSARVLAAERAAWPDVPARFVLRLLSQHINAPRI